MEIGPIIFSSFDLSSRKNKPKPNHSWLIEVVCSSQEVYMEMYGYREDL